MYIVVIVRECPNNLCNMESDDIHGLKKIAKEIGIKEDSEITGFLSDDSELEQKN